MPINLLPRVIYWLKVTIGRAEPRDRGQLRYQRLAQAILTALAGRGIQMLVGFISVPLTVRYLGAERYGVWVTISTLIGFLGFTDLGLANSVTKLVADSFGAGRDDLARRYVTTAFWLLVGLAASIGLFVWLAWDWLGVAHAFRVTTPLARAEVGPALAAALAIFLAGFPLMLVNRVLAAYQENTLANYWAMAASVLSLISIVIVTRAQGGLVALVLAFSGSSLLVSLLSAIWLFSFHRPSLSPLRAPDSATARALFHTGWKFLAVGIFWMLNSQTDNLIIAHYLDAAAVTPYSTTAKLFSLCLVVQLATVGALWPTYSEAFARGDVDWVRRAFWANFRFSLLSSAPLAIVFVFLGAPLIRIWAGDAAVPPPALLIFMALSSVLLSNTYALGGLLNGAGRLSGMAIYGGFTAVLNISLCIWGVRHYGIVGVSAAWTLAFGLANYLPALLEVRHVLNSPDGMPRAHPQE